MATRIPTGIKDTEQLGRIVDRELQRVDGVARQGFVGEQRMASRSDSYLFMDNGTLKFFNASTNETKTVTVS